jgi:hypothetical protein
VRKVNNDQVAIDVEMDKEKQLDDEDDDKGKHVSCILNTDSLDLKKKKIIIQTHF